MLVLTHFLDLRELGFAAALATTFGMFEQVTDILMNRFVFSAPHDDYEEALAAAQALSVIRGAIVGLLVVVTSPLVASIFGLRDHWMIFAALGAIVFIKSLENLGPRSAERDYQYAAQLKSNLVGAALGFGAMLIVATRTHSHLALYVQLLASISGWVVATHLFSSTSYRLKIRTPFFAQALRFGYPLMLNGVGLAVTNQGDRMLVGALLGLPALGIYSVILLAAIVPMAMLSRLTNSLTLAILHNAAAFPAAYKARMKLVGRVFPLIFALYGLGVLTLANILVPIVFGASFLMSKTLLVLLAFSAFFRLARGDPFASLLLQTSRTKRLALSSWSTFPTLIFAGLLMHLFGTIESAMWGRLLGEIVALGVTVYLVRNVYRTAFIDHAMATSVGTAILAIVAALVVVSPIGTQPVPSLSALGLGAAALGGAAALSSRSLWRPGFPNAGRFMETLARFRAAGRLTPSARRGSTIYKMGAMPTSTAGRVVICIAEDRASCETGIRLLLLSLSRAEPGASVILFCPFADRDLSSFAANVAGLSVDLRAYRPPDAYSWNVKPQALLEALNEGADEVVWIDSDVIVASPFLCRLSALDRNAITVTEEALWGASDDRDALRARLWGFPVGRQFPFTLNSSVLRVTRAHVALLERWRALLDSREYRDEQAKPWSSRKVNMIGDQDVLTALLSSKEYCDVPVEILRRGEGIVQYFGLYGFSTRERLHWSLRGKPHFIHSQGVKAWAPPVISKRRSLRDYITEAYLDASPYTIVASKLSPRDARGWAEPHTALGTALRVIGFKNPVLTGLPIACAVDVIRTAKKFLGR